jgi:pSer/pThr/pTyr-binding forkhead associated (FHA) protein
MIGDTALLPSAATQRTERSLWRHTPILVIRVQGSDVRLHAGQSCMIGRDPECDIVVADSRVSRQHAVARFVLGVWVFQDAGSANGTFLGHSRMDSSQISSDCLFRLGHQQDGPVVRCFVIHPEPGEAVTAIRVVHPSVDHRTVTVHRAPVRAVTERDIIGIGRTAFHIVGDELRELADGERTSSAVVTEPDMAGTGSTESRAAGDRAGAWLRTKAPARPPLRDVGVATATSLMALLALAAIGIWLRQPLLIPPLAASMALITAGSALPIAQPRNVIAGQLVSAVVGFAVLAVGGPGIWTAAAAGGLALGAMLLLRVAHSPAAATAVIVGATAPPAARFLVLLAAATVILVVCGVLGTRIEGKRYPNYWW